MPVIAKTTLLLILSNVFMTFAWYAHLKNLNNKAWYIAAMQAGALHPLNTCFRFRKQDRIC